jgi:hypothetical protein
MTLINEKQARTSLFRFLRQKVSTNSYYILHNQPATEANSGVKTICILGCCLFIFKERIFCHQKLEKNMPN